MGLILRGDKEEAGIGCDGTGHWGGELGKFWETKSPRGAQGQQVQSSRG